MGNQLSSLLGGGSTSQAGGLNNLLGVQGLPGVNGLTSPVAGIAGNLATGNNLGGLLGEGEGRTDGRTDPNDRHTDKPS